MTRSASTPPDTETSLVAGTMARIRATIMAETRDETSEMPNPNGRTRPLALALAFAWVAASCGSDDVTGPDPSEPSVPAEVVLEAEQIEVHSLNETLELEVEVRDQAGDLLDGVSIAWSSSEPSVLQYAGDGTFLSVGNGTSEVTATATAEESGEAVSGTATVQVQQVPAAVTVSPATITFLAIGQTAGLEAEILDAGGTPLQEGAEAGVAWSVEGGEGAALDVDGDGVLTALEDGSAEVTASSGEASGSATAEVDATFGFTACLSLGGEEAGCDGVAITAHSAEEAAEEE